MKCVKTVIIKENTYVDIGDYKVLSITNGHSHDWISFTDLKVSLYDYRKVLLL